MAKTILPLHPQHRGMDKERFILVHADKWARDLRLGSFNRKQLETIANFRYQGWSMIGTDSRRYPVIRKGEAGETWAVINNGSLEPYTGAITRWDGETDRAKKVRRAKELTAGELRVLKSSEVFEVRKQIKDQLDILEWEFLRAPDAEMAEMMKALRDRMSDLDDKVLKTRQAQEIIASLGEVPTFDFDDE